MTKPSKKFTWGAWPRDWFLLSSRGTISRLGIKPPTTPVGLGTFLVSSSSFRSSRTNLYNLSTHEGHYENVKTRLHLVLVTWSSEIGLFASSRPFEQPKMCIHEQSIILTPFQNKLLRLRLKMSSGERSLTKQQHRVMSLLNGGLEMDPFIPNLIVNLWMTFYFIFSLFWERIEATP